MNRAPLCVGILIALLCAGTSWGAPQETATATQGNRLITIAGVLTDASGQPRTGSLGLTFRLYVAQAGGDPMWQEYQVAQTDVAGRYTVLLGAATPGGVPPEVFGDEKAQWLGVQVDLDAEQPRVLLVAVPYALRAVDADTLGGKPIASFVLSSDLAQAVEKQIASPTTGTTSGGGTKVTTSGAVAPLGYEGGSSTWYGQYAANAGGGSYNAFFGQDAGYAATGSFHAFFGQGAGYNTTTACCNAFFGRSAGYANTTGESNVFVGNNAGQANTTSSDNTFVGRQSGVNNTAAQNTFVGSASGYANTSGGGHAFFGYQAGYANTTAGANSFFGYQAGQVNTTGASNSFFGYQAGQANTTAGYNTFFGAYAGTANTTATENAFFGYQAGQATTTIGYNAFFGYQAGLVTTGGYNTFLGARAGIGTTTGGYNAFVGRRAGEGNTTGSNNIAIGWEAGYNSTTGSHNAFLGDLSGLSNTTESNNSFIGASTTGAGGITNATAIGYQAQVTQSNALVLGSINGVNGAAADTYVGIGTTAPSAKLHVAGDVKVGDNLSGVNDVVMGAGTALPTWSGNVEFNNESGVGFHFRALTAKFDIGPGSGGAPTYPGLLSLSMDGKVGIGTTSPSYKLHVVGTTYSSGGYVSSDLRLKEDVRTLTYGVRELLRLRPVSYRWKDPSLGQPTFGLIAQEVEPVLPELVSRGGDEAGLLSLNYIGLIPVLVNAVQEQQAVLTQKDAEIAALNARLAALEEQVQRILRQEK